MDENGVARARPTMPGVRAWPSRRGCAEGGAPALRSSTPPHAARHGAPHGTPFAPVCIPCLRPRLRGARENSVFFFSSPSESSHFDHTPHPFSPRPAAAFPRARAEGISFSDAVAGRTLLQPQQPRFDDRRVARDLVVVAAVTTKRGWRRPHGQKGQASQEKEGRRRRLFPRLAGYVPEHIAVGPRNAGSAFLLFFFRPLLTPHVKKRRP